MCRPRRTSVNHKTYVCSSTPSQGWAKTATHGEELDMCEPINAISEMDKDCNIMCVFINDIMGMGIDRDTRYKRGLQDMYVFIKAISGM